MALNRTKNGTPRGVPLNREAVAVLAGQRGKHEPYCFTYRGEPIRWGLCNTARLEAVKRAGLTDFRFHDLRHTWASWHRQAGTSTDELKGPGWLEVAGDGWTRYARFATENLAVAAARIENVGLAVGNSHVFPTLPQR